MDRSGGTSLSSSAHCMKLLWAPPQETMGLETPIGTLLLASGSPALSERREQIPELQERCVLRQQHLSAALTLALSLETRAGLSAALQGAIGKQRLVELSLHFPSCMWP